MEKKGNKFILDIVPLTKIPLTRNQSFCYLSAEKLPIGTLVSIPLFRRNVEGIVVKSRSDFKRLGNIELKKVNKIIEEEFLTPCQLELAKFISDYYISPLGVVMKNFVPRRANARNLQLVISNSETKKIDLTTEQKKAVKQIINYHLPVTNYLLFGPASSGKTEVYIHSILELRRKDEDLQFLILVPEQTLTPQAIERYGQYFNPEEIVALSSNITAGQLYSNWKKIKSGEARIIIATRKGVFAPFRKLGLIIVDEEQDISFKQWDMNPRYDARTVAEKLAEFHNCPIVFGSATPSVESYYGAIKKDLKLLTLPELTVCHSRESGNPGAITGSRVKPGMTTEIVDMRLERLNKNVSCISKKLKSEVAYALKNRLQTILFINRQGMSNFSVCDSCKTVLKCPKCDRALVYDNSGRYKCVHCTHKTSIIPSCPKCKGIIFKNVGLGTQKVEKEIINLFPGARVARIDSQTIKSAKYQENIHPHTKTDNKNAPNKFIFNKKGFGVGVYKKFSQGEIDILIGTQMISKGWDLPNVALVGIIDADNMLSIPDFSGSERFFQNIVQVSGRVSRPGAKFPGVVVLQTYQPENKLVKLAAGRNWEKFFELEIAERKALNLPPFAKIIKLVFQDYSFKRAESEVDRIYSLLKNIKNISISEPQDAYISKIRGRFRHQIVIKYNKEIPPQLRKILNGLGQGWIIDINPISII